MRRTYSSDKSPTLISGRPHQAFSRQAPRAMISRRDWGMTLIRSFNGGENTSPPRAFSHFLQEACRGF